MTADSPGVLCVVIHWGSVDDTLACVASLMKQDYPSAEVVILDNGTEDEIGLRLGGAAHNVRIIHLSENTGFTGGANRAVALAREGGFKWCWILNNDTEFEQTDCLANLVSFSADSSAAITAPIIRNHCRGRIRESAWALFFPSLALTLHERGWVAPILKSICRSKRFISGTAWFVNVNTAPQPFLDETFFAYFEDVDLGIRLGEDGMRVCSEVTVTHHVSAGTGGGLRKHYLKTRNIVYLAGKHDLWNPRFRLSFWFIFALSESRKYWRQLPSFWHTTRSALADGRAGVP